MMRAVQTFAQTLSRLEVRGVSRRKRYWRSGPGIAAKACTAETYREAAEATDLDSTSGGKVRRHVLKHHVHRHCDVSLDEMGLRLRNPLDQLRLRHSPIVPSKTTLCPRMGDDADVAPRGRRPMPVPTGRIHGSARRERCRCATVRSTGHSFRSDLLPNVMCVRPYVLVIERGVAVRAGRAYRRIAQSTRDVGRSLSTCP